jgi:hypothetical protein
MVETAGEYLREYGSEPGERTDKAAELFRKGTVRVREKQLANRFNNPKWRSEPEGDDPHAYAAAMAAMQQEQEGRLDEARSFWEKVKAAFPEEAKLPFTFDDAVLARARWGWLAQKRIDDIKAAKDRPRQIAARIADHRKYEKPTSFDPNNPESLAMKAIRLQEFGDDDKAAQVWEELASLAAKDTGLHDWFLLASERRAGIRRETDAVTRRYERIRDKVEAAAKTYTALKERKGTGESVSAIEWMSLRARCREIVELYSDESGVVGGEVKKAQKLLDDAAKES